MMTICSRAVPPVACARALCARAGVGWQPARSLFGQSFEVRRTTRDGRGDAGGATANLGALVSALTAQIYIALGAMTLAGADKPRRTSALSPRLRVQVGHIEALERTDTGSRSSQWARANKLIPGIIHGVDAEGRDEVELVYVRDSDLRREVGRRGQTFSNTLFDMCVTAAQAP